jgi:hypothetical protein
MRKFRITRDVTPDECSWLEGTLERGKELHEYIGYTYGVVSPAGVACSLNSGETPFFEVPITALEVLK